MTTKKFTIDFGVTGEKRKRLADIIATFMQTDKVYLGAPTFAYEVGCFTVDKNGVVSFDDGIDGEEVKGLLEVLAYEGFVAATSDFDPNTEQMPEQAKESDTGAPVAFTAAVPLDKVNIGNLTNLLEAKGELIKKALGVESVATEMTEDSVCFPWFEKTLTEDEVKAYTHLISALCKMSLEQKRINSKEKATDNEKYTFRCLLLRLGFIGDEYKTERRILLRNLRGSSAFRSAVRKAKVDDAFE